MTQEYVEGLVRQALEEDVGSGDVTTLWCVPEDRAAFARVIAKAPGVISGMKAATTAFRLVDPDIIVDVIADDAASVGSGDEVIRLSGPARGILTAERVALNFLQRLSGVATLTRAFVSAVSGTSARILDTRKTTPGLRSLERAAVRHGGGSNHRFGLFDMVLIKENHIAAAGGIPEAVASVRARNDESLRIEVETRSLDEVDLALRAGVDRIMLDNMHPEALRVAVERIGPADPRPEIEASGGVTLDSVRRIAETGVDFVSVGGLTHSAAALDLSLLFDDA